ncbi:ABC transporter permease [Streptomyces sp. NPDC004779]|uniref:ABC transporter permease n=1 Tax=Streptomyces sp. NPDC056049 TaxID=3345693 RepID=UPI0035E2A10C
MSTFSEFLSDGATLTRRNVIKNRRTPDVIVWTIMAPVSFALLFAFVFGSAIDVPGSNYREYLIAGILVQTMLNTSLNTGAAIADDMKKGLIDRFRSLPISPASVLVGRTTSDMLNNILVIAIMAVTGLLIGWRVRSSFLEAAAGFGLLLLFAYACAWITAWLGVGAKSPEALANGLMMLTMPMMFISNAFVPSDGLPSVLRVIAEWSPVSAVVGATRELFGNTPPGATTSGAWPMEHPVLASLGWVTLILVVFIPLAVSRFNKSVSQ